ncbi:hypothetical protein J7L68_04200 [bacterium]|nr:hypothetical protein [bacterium]
MRKIIFIIIILAMGIIFGAGEPNKYLWLGIGARSLALGNTGVALNDLNCASFYNPASVSERGKFSLAGGNQFLALDRNIYYGSLASEVSEGAGIGLTWIHSSVGDVISRNIDGEIQGTISNGNDAIYFAFAKRVYSNIHLGLGVEYMQSSLENLTTGTAGFGAGLSYRMKNPQITFGFAAQNLFMKISWNSNNYYGLGYVSDEEISMLFRGGISYESKISSFPFVITGDIWQFSSDQINYGTGIEIAPFPQLNLRAGFTDSRPSAGIGIHTKIGKFSLVGLNYAFVIEREKLMPRHIIDLTVEY